MLADVSHNTCLSSKLYTDSRTRQWLSFSFWWIHLAEGSHCILKGSQQCVTLQADEDCDSHVSPRGDLSLRSSVSGRATSSGALLSSWSPWVSTQSFACWVKSLRWSGLLMFTFVVKVTGQGPQQAVKPTPHGLLQQNLSSEFPVVLGSGPWL